METKLQQKRREKGYSQKDFSDLVGLSIYVYQSYELNRRKLENASYKTVKAICQALQCEPEEVLN